MKAMLPFYALFVGDGSTTNFVLDISKDPWYLANDLTGFNTDEALPTGTILSPGFDPKLSPSGAVSVTSRNALNNSNYDPTSVSVTQYQLSFTLNSAPSNGTVFVIQGFIQY